MSDLIYTARLDESDDSVIYSDHYSNHISAMTSEKLNSKSDIACELAVRDIQIQKLEQCLSQLGNTDRLAQFFKHEFGITGIPEQFDKCESLCRWLKVKEE